MFAHRSLYMCGCVTDENEAGGGGGGDGGVQIKAEREKA